ncbi:GNAT family N-acetyltransferase [Streptomyces sp. MS2A]|nr:GNAT family N-acetyltransferase [Streptomyces sp. MS2A]
MTVQVRRIRMDEWEQVRDLRLRALADPAAGIAFLDTVAGASAQPDDFWRLRAANAAVGTGAAQFIAVEATGQWCATLTVLHADGPERTGLVVGVYVAEGRRGTGTIDALFDEAARWAADAGATALALDVHVDNARAQAAYARNGFVRTGEIAEASIGREYVMRRELEPSR